MTEPQLDAVEVIRRIEQYEPHLVARVIAEMQLEQLQHASANGSAAPVSTADPDIRSAVVAD